MTEMTEVQRKWRDENMEAIREGVKAVKEGRTMPADTFFEWMQAKYVRDIWDSRIADLEAENARLQVRAAEYAAALERLQQRFNEVWTQHQRMLLALESARDIIHRTQCRTLPSLPQQCWKECEEAMDAMLEAGWMPLDVKEVAQ